jgi:hypothetical protein
MEFAQMVLKIFQSPAGFETKSHKEHYDFLSEEVPDSWNKFRDIALYWTAKRVVSDMIWPKWFPMNFGAI